MLAKTGPTAQFLSRQRRKSGF